MPMLGSLVPRGYYRDRQGMFVFKGRSKETDSARDFEPVEGPAGLKLKGE